MAIDSRTITGLLFLALVASNAVADKNRVGRYLTVEPIAEESAKFPLIRISEYNIPTNAVTVEQAMLFVLAGTGYDIAPDRVLDPQSLTMLDSPVAEIQRTLTNVTPLNAMAALAGPGFEVVVDPLSRRVAFDVCLHKPANIDNTKRSSQ